MNVCLVSREYPSDDHAGGIGTYTEKTAKALAGMGVRVDVITESVGGPSTTVEDGVTVHRLRHTRASQLRSLVRSRAVARAIERLPVRPDIVQACEYGAEAFWYSFRKPAGTRLVTRLATPSFLVRRLNRHTNVASSRRRIYVEWMERVQAARSDGVIAITHALADVVCAEWPLPRSRVSVIKTGVDFARRHGGQATTFDPGLSGHEYLLYFGRLEERKGVHVLAQALPRVLAAHPGLHVVFAGASVPYGGAPMQSFVERCTRQSADRVHFFPRLPQRAVHSLLSNALFALVPSLWEGLGNVALEALDMGKPVVATRHSGLAEIVEDRRSGLLVEPGDVDDLAGAILTLLDDRALLRRLAAGAKSRAREFELTKAAGDLLVFYHRMLRGKGEPAAQSPALRDPDSAWAAPDARWARGGP